MSVIVLISISEVVKLKSSPTAIESPSKSLGGKAKPTGPDEELVPCW